MRRLLLALTMTLGVLSATAQQYAVYRVKGEAVQVVKKNKTTLQKGMTLTPKDIISLGARSELKLFDEENREMITLRNQCAGSVASIIASQQGARQSMTQDYFVFILKNMAGRGENENLQAGRTTAIFRADEDSLLASAEQGPVFLPLLEEGYLDGVEVIGVYEANETLQVRGIRRKPYRMRIIVPDKKRKRRW